MEVSYVSDFEFLIFLNNILKCLNKLPVAIFKQQSETCLPRRNGISKAGIGELARFRRHELGAGNLEAGN